MRATLSNLRSAGFDVAESNVLLRALYSWNDELNGRALRLEAWRLLARRRDFLRKAADKLADEVRTHAQPCAQPSPLGLTSWPRAPGPRVLVITP